MSCDASDVESKEIVLERCIVFRLDLPGQRLTMAMRARANRSLKDVIEPVLIKNGLSMKDVIMHIVCLFFISFLTI
jgi:hypothetical protein